MPLDVTNLINNYQKNILYVNVNFVWTHKYQCCYNTRTCNYLKNNRGNYVFERDPNNRFDTNAIKILTPNGKHVGHIPRGIAECLASLLDENKINLCSVGGEKKKPCSEMIEIVPLVSLTEDEYECLECLSEKIPYDKNRYIHSSN
eukprot:261679_1